MVSGPTQTMRAGQRRAAVRSWTSAAASSMPRDHLADRPRLDRGGEAVDRLAADERGRDRTVRIRRDDDDRQRAAGPREVDEAADAGLPGGLGERPIGGGGRG